MTHATLENKGYTVRTDIDGWFVLSTLVNVRNLAVSAWGTATIIDIKTYKTLKAAQKKGEMFLVAN